MSDTYTIIRAGRQTDFSVFWKYFDNYMISAAHWENIDEQILGWYLTDGYHEDFYEKIFDPMSATQLYLFYREKETVPRESQGGFLRGLFQDRRHRGHQILVNHRLDYRTSEGTCVGFCILEQATEMEGGAWIRAMSLEGLDGSNHEKIILWKKMEDRLRQMGIRTLETTGYRKQNFWIASGFEHNAQHILRKRL